MWEYLTVFVLAATPLVELLVVIPVGIGLGLAPVPVAVVAFAGNALPVVAIVGLLDRWQRWRQQSGEGAADGPGAPAPSARRDRARRIWTRYGMPGLALLAPLVTGVHLATLAALALGAPRHTVVRWMVASIAVWCAAVTLATVGGIDVFRRLIGG